MNVMDAVCEKTEQSGNVNDSAFLGSEFDGHPNNTPLTHRQMRDSKRYVRAGMGGSFKTPYEMRGVAASARSRRWSSEATGTRSFDSSGVGLRSFDLSPSRKSGMLRSFEVKEPEAYQLLDDHLEPHLSAGENAVNLLKAMMEVRRVAQEQGNDDNKGFGFRFPAAAAAMYARGTIRPPFIEQQRDY
jgi:hypothetical protein